MKMCFKFHQNRTKNEEFDFGELREEENPNFINSEKPTENGGPIAHRKFQDSGLTGEYLKIGGTEM